ncbi:hypothetical protein [Candidatus Laterigemmans baculatus]|uniref:hypothetical protein n=1 Tax=Candidatus Laterigemmans baculatus TaxID=2770505 RepID=UPI0013DD2E0F|nr:hypothetical protein [Candidatus Laterigemmans baculatus]
MSHSIRLRAGWTRQTGSQQRGSQQTGSQQTAVGLPDLPSDDRETFPGANASDAGLVRYLRPFNCPTGLGDGDGRVPVDLVIESWSGRLVARLDGAPLCDSLPSDAAPLRVAVSERLHGHHLLELELTPREGESSGCRLTGIVTLEIHD